MAGTAEKDAEKDAVTDATTVKMAADTATKELRLKNLEVSGKKGEYIWNPIQTDHFR